METGKCVKVLSKEVHNHNGIGSVFFFPKNSDPGFHKIMGLLWGSIPSTVHYVGAGLEGFVPPRHHVKHIHDEKESLYLSVFLNSIPSFAFLGSRLSSPFQPGIITPTIAVKDEPLGVGS